MGVCCFAPHWDLASYGPVIATSAPAREFLLVRVPNVGSGQGGEDQSLMRGHRVKHGLVLICPVK